MTLLIFNSALIVVPVSLGRTIFNTIPVLPITHGIKCNGNLFKLFYGHFALHIGIGLLIIFFFIVDLYAFIIGSYVIWTAVAGARYSIEHIRTKRVAVLLGQIWKWCAIVFKSSALLSIWVQINRVFLIYENQLLQVLDFIFPLMF